MLWVEASEKMSELNLSMRLGICIIGRSMRKKVRGASAHERRKMSYGKNEKWRSV